MIKVIVNEGHDITWFPSLMVHNETGCVAMFTATDRYVVIGVGSQSKKIGTVSNRADIIMWKPFTGSLVLRNGKTF